MQYFIPMTRAHPPSISPRIQGTPSQPLPVMLYIHGGTFRDGSANIFNFTNLAMKGVVVVTTNYRWEVV